MKVTFIGAVGTVTGSKYLLEHDGTRLLIDCGLFQGVKVLRERNWKPLPFKPESLDAILLTHAHIDHSGFLPVVCRDGFKGPIHATTPTRDLCNILLPDSAYLQEEDARYANKEGFTKHKPAQPLYTIKDAKSVSGRFKPVELDEPFEIGPLRITYQMAGHILGAASIRIEAGGQSVLFSGDLGRDNDLFMYPPAPPGDVDWVVMESTYGDRLHPEVDPIEAIAGVVKRTVERGGIVLVPALAVGRTQNVLYALKEAFARGLAPRVPVHVNSPMATDASDLYERHHRYHRLNRKESSALFGQVNFVTSIDESKKLNGLTQSAVVISASGMLTGGRVLHHLKAYAPNPDNTILLPSFQAPGTRGASLVEGATAIKLHGEYVPINAEVVQIQGLSAHADQNGLVNWLSGCSREPRGVFLVHGEPVPADVLRRKIREKLGYRARVADEMDVVDLGG